MNNQRLLIRLVLITLLCMPGITSAQEPVIAPQIGQLIAEEGVEAANQRFAELIQSPSLNYQLETQGLMTLMSGYMQAGNAEAGEAVGEMYAQVMQKMISGGASMFPPEMAEAMKNAQAAEEAAEKQRQAEQAEERKLQQKREQQSRGKSRDDLDRFVGLYSDPNSDDKLRAIFVTKSCDGYLVTGPMWADVGPWWMRSAADKVFTYADSWTNLSFEFSGDDGRGMRLNHDVEGTVNPLENKGPLPEDWPECMERPRR
jgi:hypothetical protein